MILIPQPVYVPGYGRIEAGKYPEDQLPEDLVRRLLEAGHASRIETEEAEEKARKRK